ncbi:MAG: sigma-70 family RNA polymerase sigma factor [Chitinophagaceae bacterium]|nr:sigma-70 family RNA polymerase sigma factor [Chitinophagaceae bacterium]
MINDGYDIEWRRFKEGDVKALESIYRTHIKSLINFGLKISDDMDLVKDSIQDMFIELWKYRENLTDVCEPQFYLFKALRNKLSRALSRRSFVGVGEMQLSSEDMPTTYVELEILTREQETQTRVALQQLLERLPKRQQEAVYLRFYCNFSYEAIASIKDMNYQSVLNLIQRALKTLRTEYSSILPDR